MRVELGPVIAATYVVPLPRDYVFSRKNAKIAKKDSRKKAQKAQKDSVFNDFLPKPVMEEELFEILRRHLRVKWVYAERSKFTERVI
jgi:hypothetical protein